MLSFLAPRPPPRKATAHLDTVTYEDGQSAQTFHVPDDEYFVTHTLPPSKTKTFFAPPLHHHVDQTEYFYIRSGRGRYFLSGKELLYIKGEIAQIPVGEYHRFENASATEPLVVSIRLDPDARETEVSFFRNFFGYVEDCRTAGKEPNVLQLLLFLHYVGAPLAFPIPGPQSFRNWVDRILTMILGVWIGEYLLGLKSSYPEYYRSKAK